ncbi:MAG: hypothetical protein CVU77_06555 [Elusimicrobia bacterium HGW-Elusimicrobia-1]|jgi:hypothetical protein|nr:MAG: hypothetical protein CVU77_06555 [Elusimicrobia bacterium HGW-Elusimicrobia-1]
MRVILRFFIFVVLAMPLCTRGLFAAKLTLEEIGFVVQSYYRNNVTTLVVSLDRKIPTMTTLYAKRNIPVLVDDFFHEENERFFYESTSPGHRQIGEGDKIYALMDESDAQKNIPDVYIKLEKKDFTDVFVPKKEGRVFAYHRYKVHFNRGSLHGVKERDVYAVYDSTGKYQGKFEVYGIGDKEAVGELYGRPKEYIRSEDKVVHLGTRKWFSLGLFFGVPLSVPSDEDKLEGFEKDVSMRGGGILWQFNFGDGWSACLQFPRGDSGSSYGYSQSSYRYYALSFQFPFYVKKLFLSGMALPLCGVGRRIFFRIV